MIEFTTADLAHAAMPTKPVSLKPSWLKEVDSWTLPRKGARKLFGLVGVSWGAVLVFLYSLDKFTGTLLVGVPFVTTLPVYM